MSVNDSITKLFFLSFKQSAKTMTRQAVGRTIPDFKLFLPSKFNLYLINEQYLQSNTSEIRINVMIYQSITNDDLTTEIEQTDVTFQYN